jgi:hypothetical protein
VDGCVVVADAGREGSGEQFSRHDKARTHVALPLQAGHVGFPDTRAGVDPLAVVLFTVTDWLKYTLTSGPASAADRQRTIITAVLTITVHPTGQGRPFDRPQHRRAVQSCCSNLAQCLNLSAKAASLSRETTRVIVSGVSLPRSLPT